MGFDAGHPHRAGPRVSKLTVAAHSEVVSHDDMTCEVEVGRKSFLRGKFDRRVVNNQRDVRFVERTVRAITGLQFLHRSFELAKNRFGIAEYSQLADSFGHKTEPVRGVAARQHGFHSLEPQKDL